jgi:quercetin dioxygenase-like cupin family protein
VVVPREKQMVMRDPETGFERQLLSPSFGGRGVEFIRNAVPEGSTSGEFPPHRRGVEEYVAVEKGRLNAILAGEEHLLEEGDALYFEADVTHRFDNAGDGECNYYLVIISKGT